MIKNTPSGTFIDSVNISTLIQMLRQKLTEVVFRK